ncbi:hypothetical protein SAMN04487770_13545 [Butyrivibrio sp. ob235]|uniref:hypothetical protein n=1 Tax=Butyrivibrio sp. ob235 TaxID=1761780 RepID=UPI0008D4C779|nr:hypothetical protein [Butyrivibrio sp. ob235]SEM36874.1 hypothetical protein SAMN04487770_13545 [Butyrivibrio sp. ob235]
MNELFCRRLRNWNGDKNIFECSIFQNFVEDMILFQKASDQQIVDFYKDVIDALSGKEYRIMYLQSDDISSNIDIIRKERSDVYECRIRQCFYFFKSIALNLPDFCYDNRTDFL